MNVFRRDVGVGVGWRRELSLWLEQRRDLGLIEVMAEDFPTASVPATVARLAARGAAVVPHSVSLSLAGAEPPDRLRLQALDALARNLRAPVASDHIAFVRAGGLESGHLLPPPRTQEALDVLVDNVRTAKRHLSVPLALENIATLFEWPGAEMDEATFTRELLQRTDTLFLLDVANLYANARNFGWDARTFLDEVPLDRIAYIHMAGGTESEGLYHDTHAHPVPPGPLGLLADLCERTPVPGVLLERDDRFPSPGELAGELAAIRTSVDCGVSRREA